MSFKPFELCRSLGIDPLRPTFLIQTKLGRKLNRKAKHEKRFVTVKMIKSCFLPDGTEKIPDLRTHLYAGITYSLPASIAEILIKKKLAEKEINLKNKKEGEKNEKSRSL